MNRSSRFVAILTLVVSLSGVVVWSAPPSGAALGGFCAKFTKLVFHDGNKTSDSKSVSENVKILKAHVANLRSSNPPKAWKNVIDDWVAANNATIAKFAGKTSVPHFGAAYDDELSKLPLWQKYQTDYLAALSHCT